MDGAGGGAIISKKKKTSTADPAEPTVNTSAMQVLPVGPKTRSNECDPRTSQRMIQEDNYYYCILSEIYALYIVFCLMVEYPTPDLKKAELEFLV